MSADDEIRTLLEARIEAFERRDAAAANAVLHPYIVAFEVAGPLQIPSAQATDANLTQTWLDSFEDGPKVTMEELSIHVEGALAFCHSLNHLEGRRTDGQEVDVRMRSTLGLRKFDGDWKIIHGHTSLPR